MTIILKNKHTLKVDEFYFKCCVGKNGLAKKKKEGDKKTPKGSFQIENLYFRADRIKKPQTSLKCVAINKDMGWCNDIKSSKKYNKLVKIRDGIKCEKLKRRDHKYDLLIPIQYNFSNPVPGFGSCIFIHLTRDYKGTAGCIGLSKKDFLIMLRIINKKTKINIL